MQLRLAIDLFAQVRRRIDQEPMKTVGAHRDRGLSRRPRRGIARPRAPAGVAVAVPLREAAARGRAQDKNANHLTQSRFVLNQRLRAIKTQSSAQT
jgi:hypothetical protein